jgi:hypothetical protein
MSTVNEYHTYARDCLRWAARARTEQQRKQLLSLARDWTQSALGLEGVSVPPAPSALVGWPSKPDRGPLPVDPSNDVRGLYRQS